ncbi:hypothetical protein C482_16138 [Natrialba chahannaoensis JCM 10990]|uniref:DUF6997 domain-containing protein n=1 Tax=Natrialba chahannaoensis JCM 10990 TaxID=1227492 RepID=M0AE29_9EURY|nr:hypothetical protein [Natrialba chahannaoensis]ELY96122.1 hypothetical protein C482_16138 [Natrialba chahannaoensis JCM 10990]
MSSVFGPALDELAATAQQVLGPRSFRDYVSTHDLDATRTARYISVDSLADLAPELREAGAMVLRMGSAPNGTGTAFVLVDGPNGMADFFLHDDVLFGGLASDPVPSVVEQAQLLNFSVLPSLSETSLVNLGLASGVLSHALDLDTTGALTPPATGRSTFTFDLRPHSVLEPTVTHRTGQVETDTLFVERRDGDPTLFVVEAKTGPRATLAKHKLVYPILAVADSVPLDIEIVPVYLRCRQTDETITFDVAECSFPDPRQQVPGVDELEVVRSSVVEHDVPDA